MQIESTKIVAQRPTPIGKMSLGFLIKKKDFRIERGALYTIYIRKSTREELEDGR